VIGFGDETEFGAVLRFLMASRGLRRAEELARLLKEFGHEVTAEEIAAYVEGRKWVDGRFPRRVAEVLDLSAWEMGVLAYAVAYRQVRQPP